MGPEVCALWFVVRKVFDVPGGAEIEPGLQALCRGWGGERGAKQCVESWMKGDGSLGRPTLSSIPVVACLTKVWTREPRISGAGRARWAGICYFLLLLGIEVRSFTLITGLLFATRARGPLQSSPQPFFFSFIS